MNNGMDFYRLRFEFMGEDETGKLITKNKKIWLSQSITLMLKLLH